MQPESMLIGIITEKDTASRITKCNSVFLEYAGVKSDNSILGRTDYDMPWCDYADFYKAHELDVLKGRLYSAIIPLKDYQGQYRLFLHTKVQNLDENQKCCGILCRATEILNQDMHSLVHMLSGKNKIGEEKFFINKQKEPIQLSKRQSEVLFLLMRGKTAKSIAKIMNISFRTVESYIEIIKNKSHCNSKNELIEWAINQGLAQQFPEHLSPKTLFEKLNSN